MLRMRPRRDNHRHHPSFLSSSQLCDHLLSRNPPVAIGLRDRIVELGLFVGRELEIIANVRRRSLSVTRGTPARAHAAGQIAPDRRP
jgi:hypothetical protein